MSDCKSPSDATLVAYAGGLLRTSQAVVVDVHLSLCPDTLRRLSAFERIGGAVLETIAPVALSNGALARVESRIDAAPLPLPKPANSNTIDGLPEPLLRFSLGPRRWAGRGVSYRKVLVPDDGGCHAVLMRVEPGLPLPDHGHSGSEFTCVISGSYSNGDLVFGPGDFETAGPDTHHRPVAGTNEPCVCVIAVEGGIRLRGALGMLLHYLRADMIAAPLRRSERR
jgi:putative transcriptional regulator